MKNSFSDYLFSPLVWIQIIILFLLLTLLALFITPLGPLLGAWVGNSLVKGLTIEGVSGSFLTQLKVDKLEWVDGDVTTVSDIDLEFGRPNFSKNLAIIDSLTVSSLTIALAEGTPARQRAKRVIIGDFGIAPVNLLIASGKLNSFIMTEGTETLLQLDNVSLDSAQAKDNQLILSNVQASMLVSDLPPVDLAIADMSMDMLEPHALVLNADFYWDHPQIGVVTLNAKGSGLLQQYELLASGDIINPEYGNQTLLVKGKGDFDFLDIESFSLKGDDGEMQAKGELAWVPNLSTDLTIDADNLSTAQFTPEWPAEITGEFTLKGSIEQNKLRGEFDIRLLNGRLRGYPLSGSGKMSMLNEELIFEKLVLRSADNTIKVDGRGSEPFDLVWDVDGKDISTLAPGLTGRVAAQGSLTGTIDEPVLNGAIKANRLLFQGYKADSADLDIKTHRGQFQLSGKARGVSLGNERFSDISLRGNGDVKKHSIALSADHPEAKLIVKAQGGLEAGTWKGLVDELSVDNPAFGRWRLAEPVNVIVSTAGVEAGKLCMVSATGSACTEINYSEQTGFATAGALKNAPIDLLNPFLPAGLAIKGRVAGNYKVSLDPDLKGNADLSFAPGALVFTQDGKVQQFAYQKGSVTIDVDGNNIKSDISFDLPERGAISVTADIKLSPTDGKHTINSKGQYQEVPLGLAQVLFPEGMGLAGQVSGLFDLQHSDSGRSGKLSLNSGEVRFSQSNAATEQQRYDFDKLTVVATLSDDNVVVDVALNIRDGGSFSTRATADLNQPNLIKSFEVEGQIKEMPLALARPYLPKEIDIDGSISGQYQVRQEAAGPVGQVDLLAKGGFFSYQPVGGKRERYRYNLAQLQGSVKEDQVLAEIALELKDGGVLTSKVGAVASSLDKKPIFTAEGVLKELPIALAQAYLPKELEVAGRISGLYQLEQNDQLKGQVELNVTDSSVRFDDGKIEAQRHHFSSAGIVAYIAGDKVSTDLNIKLRDGGEFNTKGRLDLTQANNLFGFEGEGSLKAFPLALVQPYIPAKVMLKGVVDGRYQLTQKDGQQGSVQLQLSASSVTLIDDKGELRTFDYKFGELNATIKGKQIVSDMLLEMHPGGVISAKGNITLGSLAKSHIMNVQGELQEVPLGLLKPYLPKYFNFPGKVTGRYALSQRGGKLAGDVALSLPNSYFIVQTASGDKQSFAYQNGVLNAEIDGNRINVDTSLEIKGRGDFKGRAQISLKGKGAPTIIGTAVVDIPNIYWAQNYVPNSRGLRGTVVGSVKFSGLVSKPSVTGQVTMSNGYLRLPQVGTELSNIALKISANRANQATIVGTMNSGGGMIRANGNLSLNDIKNWSAKMSLDGENIKFVDTHEAVAYMTPKLQINANSKAVVITGTVDIPKADINLKDLPEFSIDESDDVIVIGEAQAGEEIKAVRMQPNVLVRLGDAVNFKGFGFSTRLVGGIRVTNSRNTIATNGSLNIVNGRYQAYGQDLRIANGRLVFNGLPKSVGVDVRAVRPVEDIGTVGIHLTGTIQKLKSTIFSDPVMQETDALSYLLTGQSLTSATGRETALLMQAVRGLGIDGSEGLIQRIGKSLGLDDLSIVTREDFRDSELQLGKRLGSKLYVKYLVGLFDSAHRLAVEYRVNKYLNFEVQAGANEQSIDLIYEYEKD